MKDFGSLSSTVNNYFVERKYFNVELWTVRARALCRIGPWRTIIGGGRLHKQNAQVIITGSCGSI
jgi:hypothetical protein